MKLEKLTTKQIEQMNARSTRRLHRMIYDSMKDRAPVCVSMLDGHAYIDIEALTPTGMYFTGISVGARGDNKRHTFRCAYVKEISWM